MLSRIPESTEMDQARIDLALNQLSIWGPDFDPNALRTVLEEKLSEHDPRLAVMREPRIVIIPPNFNARVMEVIERGKFPGGMSVSCSSDQWRGGGSDQGYVDSVLRSSRADEMSAYVIDQRPFEVAWNQAEIGNLQGVAGLDAVLMLLEQMHLNSVLDMKNLQGVRKQDVGIFAAHCDGSLIKACNNKPAVPFLSLYRDNSGVAMLTAQYLNELDEFDDGSPLDDPDYLRFFRAMAIL